MPLAVVDPSAVVPGCSLAGCLGRLQDAGTLLTESASHPWSGPGDPDPGQPTLPPNAPAMRTQSANPPCLRPRLPARPTFDSPRRRPPVRSPPTLNLIGDSTPPQNGKRVAAGQGQFLSHLWASRPWATCVWPGRCLGEGWEPTQTAARVSRCSPTRKCPWRAQTDCPAHRPSSTAPPSSAAAPSGPRCRSPALRPMAAPI
ncbi:uncharacterized protein BJ171DRAFT_525025 [Polychytrium aggregatum]|uniref:uncharacterized protein n=1 Tax=Polychytrium aggregatum TaxID=110093 RepID=UPI0022FDE064|nr:uncharacterized protein BJ171DRAFT_525025 [Polychytrium aggregatum]KAI9193554.1 hypothetical protein BJ171DRAFT_525025 [Polychytrium aggregatum]